MYFVKIGVFWLKTPDMLLQKLRQKFFSKFMKLWPKNPKICENYIFWPKKKREICEKFKNTKICFFFSKWPKYVKTYVLCFHIEILTLIINLQDPFLEPRWSRGSNKWAEGVVYIPVGRFTHAIHNFITRLRNKFFPESSKMTGEL